MLSEQTIRTIKSTVPVLEVHGAAITSRFYHMLFTAHPELLNLFNHANQKQGRQPAALANAVYAAALHIDNLAAILPVVKQIGHKHRSLGVKPEHYPIVGQTLLAAIRDVLGEAATDDIIEAWAEAYGVIADAFIGVEAEMYAEAQQRAGGWEGFRPFRIARKQQESEVIASFYLEPEDGGAIAAYEPGQYVSVKLSIPGEAYTHIRQYSLSDAPGRGYYRISVKREEGDDSRAAGVVSGYLHGNAKEGDVLLLSAPAGDFVLDRTDTRPVVLIAGGVGLTPLVSMLHTLAETQPARAVTFIHSVQNGAVHAMRESVRELAARHPQLTVRFLYDRPSDSDREQQLYDYEGRIGLEWLQTVVQDREASFYFCGPIPFMKTVYQALREWGVPAADVHYEFFGPAGSLQAD